MQYRMEASWDILQALVNGTALSLSLEHQQLCTELFTATPVLS